MDDQTQTEAANTTIDVSGPPVGVTTIQMPRTVPVKQRPQVRPTGGARQLDWVVEKVFADEAKNVYVQVVRLPVSPPKFDVRPGSMTQHGIRNHLGTAFAVSNGVIQVDMRGAALGRLVDEAYLYIQERMQEVQDREMERRQYLETKRDRPQTSVLSPLSSGMTPEKREAKKRRHEANMAARRAADSDRTSRTKGKGK